MTDYSELVKALRHCSHDGPVKCNECKYYGKEWPFGCEEEMMRDAADAIEALQAEVERLKDSNEELRERQTYIDHYGDKWMTSAKDVPTAAYEHGYADGRDEAEAHLPKRGKWIYHPKDAIEMMFTLPKCSICGHESSDALNYCPNCGAKMEVQV